MAAIHIAFGDSAAGGLKAALKIYGQQQKESSESSNEFAEHAAILPCLDRFSIGPVYEMDLPTGFFDRINWLGDFLEMNLEPEMCLDDVDDILERISDFYKKLAWVENEQQVVLWHGENVIEQMGVRLVHSLLPDCQLFEVSLEDATERSAYPDELPRRVGECSPELLMSLLPFIRPVSAETMSRWEEDWQTLIQTKGILRIWNGKAIETVPVDYFDEALLRNAEKEPRLASWIIGDVLGEGVCETCCDFLSWRLRLLVESGILMATGSFESFRTYQVALA